MKVSTQIQQYLTSTTHVGLCKYLRLPFGIASASAIWQKAMAVILQVPWGDILLPRRHNILVMGTTKKELEKDFMTSFIWITVVWAKTQYI